MKKAIPHQENLSKYMHPHGHHNKFDHFQDIGPLAYL